MISPEVLRRFPFFAGVDPECFKELAMIGQEVELGRGGWLFHEGDDADAFYLILSGTVELKIPLSEGKFADLEQLVEGEVTGWSALVEPYVYTLSAMSSAETRLVKFDGLKLRDLLARNPEVGYHLMCHLARDISKRLTRLRIRFVSLVEPPD